MRLSLQLLHSLFAICVLSLLTSLSGRAQSGAQNAPLNLKLIIFHPRQVEGVTVAGNYVRVTDLPSFERVKRKRTEIYFARFKIGKILEDIRVMLLGDYQTTAQVKEGIENGVVTTIDISSCIIEESKNFYYWNQGECWGRTITDSRFDPVSCRVTLLAGDLAQKVKNYEEAHSLDEALKRWPQSGRHSYRLVDTSKCRPYSVPLD